jgi:Chlorophyll A-B binding protein
LSSNIDQATFDKYREAELKHGRVCMLGIAGYVNPEIWRFPGEIAPGLKFADVPNGLKAIDAIPTLGWLQMFFLIGAVDYYGFLRYDSGIPDLAPEEMERRKVSELTHGRLAMLGFLELVRHDAHNIVNPGMDGGLMDLITGFPFLYNEGLWGDLPHY